MSEKDKPPPLAGIRVLDVTTAWAGPYAGKVLAALGADVVHVEAATRPDLWRGPARGDNPERYPDLDPGARPWNRSLNFNSQNLGKRSLCIDIKKPGGAEALRAVAATADVILSNFTPGTLARMGLDYYDLAKANPGVIVLEMPAHGTWGPMARLTALGPSMEFASGMASLTGYGDGEPIPTGPAYLDPIGGYNAAAAIMIALHERCRTGRGQRIEISQVEAAMAMVGEQILDCLAHDLPPSPAGNHRRGFLVHDALPCRGEEAWIAIAVPQDDEAGWRSLLAELDLADLPSDPRFVSPGAAITERATLLARLAEATASRDKHDLADRLQAAGVAAAPVSHGRDVALDPHLGAVDYFFDALHAEVGMRRYQGHVMTFERSRRPVLSGSPTLGQHTDEVLREWAAFDDDRIAALRRDGTTDNDPPG